MKPKLILIISILSLLIITTVFATSWSISQFENTLAAGSDYTKNAYKVTYDIEKPGWYLLPSRTFSDNVGHFVEGTDYSLLDSPEKVSYRYAFSPFTKKYVRCTGVGSTLSCKEKMEEILGDQDPETALDYVGFAADWYYYEKPIKFEFEYQPPDIAELITTKLKAGWNLITFPAYLATDELQLSNCNILKVFIYDDEEQQWIAIPLDSIDSDMSYIGGGVAIKVQNDCTLLEKIEEEIAPPPTIPT